MNKELSFVIPCYNEEENISPVIETIANVFSGIDFELIFIDDGSSDNTWKRICDKAAEGGISIKAVRFSRNFGKEAAIYAGLEKCESKYTVLIDADLQQNPTVAYKMYEILCNNSELDMVVAYQDKRKESKILRMWKKAFYKIINNLSEIDFVKDASDFRAFNSKVRDAVLKMK